MFPHQLGHQNKAIKKNVCLISNKYLIYLSNHKIADTCQFSVGFLCTTSFVIHLKNLLYV